MYKLDNMHFCHIELHACLSLEINKYLLGVELNHPLNSVCDSN